MQKNLQIKQKEKIFIRELSSIFMVNRFLLFGDNIWESKHVIELIEQYCSDLLEDLRLEGCPSLPIYHLKYKGKEIIVECRGDYNNWKDLPKEVGDYINLFDKPDAVLYHVNKKKVVCAAEFTETVSVGNSQWQRSGRVVASTINNVPFLAVYPSVAEDDSQKTLREPTSLLTELFLKLSIDDPENPTLLVLREDPYLSSLNKKRLKQGLNKLKKFNGEKVIAFWFLYRILSNTDFKQNKNLLKLEKEVYKEMFKTLNEKTKKRNRIMKRIDKDLPYWSKILKTPKKFEELRAHTLSEVCLLPWRGISGKIASNSYFNKNFINSVKKRFGNIFRTYVKRGRYCIIESKYTRDVEKIILKKYPPLKEFFWEEGTLDQNLPIVFIPLQGWQREGLMLSDPNCGEAAAFPALFNSFEMKKTNIIYVIYGKPTEKWLNLYHKANSFGRQSKLFRVVKKLGDILCIDINNGGDNKPTSINLK